MKIFKFSKLSKVAFLKNTTVMIRQMFLSNVFNALSMGFSVDKLCEGPVSKTVWAAASCWINET